jgi:hypothetical protein
MITADGSTTLKPSISARSRDCSIHSPTERRLDCGDAESLRGGTASIASRLGICFAPGHGNVANFDLIAALVKPDVVADADLRQDDAQFLRDLVTDARHAFQQVAARSRIGKADQPDTEFQFERIDAIVFGARGTLLGLVFLLVERSALCVLPSPAPSRRNRRSESIGIVGRGSRPERTESRRQQRFGRWNNWFMTSREIIPTTA